VLRALRGAPKPPLPVASSRCPGSASRINCRAKLHLRDASALTSVPPRSACPVSAGR
jgi:hypothetical protein